MSRRRLTVRPRLHFPEFSPFYSHESLFNIFYTIIVCRNITRKYSIHKTKNTVEKFEGFALKVKMQKKVPSPISAATEVLGGTQLDVFTACERCLSRIFVSSYIIFI